MPSRNVKDLRGYTDVSYMFIDEADYFEPSVNNELLHSITAYEEKSNCTTIMASTPNRPGGLFQQIEMDNNSKYHKIMLDYTVGLDKIYDRKEIEKKKNEPEFLREYGGHYLGKVGNVFLPSQIEECINLGLEYSTDKIPVSLYTLKSVGIDPGFSSSSTGIVILEHIKTMNDNKHMIRVVDSYLIDKGDPNEIVNICWDIWKRYGYMNVAYFIDGSNRAMVNLLKIRLQESLSWESKQSFGSNVKIRPVNFSTEHKNMLSNLHVMVSKSYLAIEERHGKLLKIDFGEHTDEIKRIWEGKPPTKLVEKWKEEGVSMSNAEKYYNAPSMNSRYNAVKKLVGYNNNLAGYCSKCRNLNTYLLKQKIAGAVIITRYCEQHVPENL